MTKVIRKGIEGLVLMIKSAKNCLSQMIAPQQFKKTVLEEKLLLIFDHKTHERIRSL